MKNCGLCVFRGVFVSGLPFFGEMERWVAWNPSWREPFCSSRAAEQLIWNQISSDPSWWLGRPCISHFPFLYFRFPGCKDHEALVGVCWGQHLWCCLAGGHSILVQNICLQGSLIPKGLFYPVHFTVLHHLPLAHHFLVQEGIPTETPQQISLLPGGSTSSSLELQLLVAMMVAKRKALLTEIIQSENLTILVGFFQP